MTTIEELERRIEMLERKMVIPPGPYRVSTKEEIAEMIERVTEERKQSTEPRKPRTWWLHLRLQPTDDILGYVRDNGQCGKCIPVREILRDEDGNEIESEEVRKLRFNYAVEQNNHQQCRRDYDRFTAENERLVNENKRMVGRAAGDEDRIASLTRALEVTDKMNNALDAAVAKLTAERDALAKSQCKVFRVVQTDHCIRGTCYSFFGHFNVHLDDGTKYMNIAELSMYGIRKLAADVAKGE